MPEVSPSRSHWHRPDRTKQCIMCSEDKSLAEFYAYRYTTKQGKRSTRYESRCRPCAKARRRAQHADNRDVEIKVSRKWREANPEAMIAQRRAYQASTHGKRVKAKAQRARVARIRSGTPGPEKKEIMAVYAEAQELEAIFGVKLHVDHITPLSKGGKHELRNLQIMTARDNLLKGGALQPSQRDHGTSDA